MERGYGGAVAINDKDDSLGTKRPRRKRPLKLLTSKKTFPEDITDNEKENDNDADNNGNISDFDFGEHD